VLRELDDLYIPTNERQLRRIQRKGDDLDRAMRNWAQSVVELLPRGLPINNDETLLLSLFLAQQRRLNAQMDDGQQDTSLLATVKRSLLFDVSNDDPETRRAVHRIVATRLDSDIDRTCNFFCSDNGLEPDADPAIDWRVSIRFMAQSIYSRVASTDPKRMSTSPRRFELAIVARDLASEVADKRYRMFQLLGARPR
jgi:hypothetical protein